MHFFEQACRRDRKHFMAFLRLGDIYRQQGRASEAVEFYTRAIMINPQNEEILSTVEQAYQRAIDANDHREVYLEAQDQLKSLGSKVQ